MLNGTLIYSESVRHLARHFNLSYIIICVYPNIRQYLPICVQSRYRWNSFVYRSSIAVVNKNKVQNVKEVTPSRMGCLSPRREIVHFENKRDGYK